jgi:hypothetical protein
MPAIASAKVSRLPGDQRAMVIGHCIWGKTAQEPDTLELYRVFDAPRFGPMLIEKPAAVATGRVAQKRLNRLCYYGEQAIDEIRIGPTLHSVMIGTKPLVQKKD